MTTRDLRVPTLREQIQNMGKCGAIMPCGLPTLDDCTRGGLRSGSLVFLAGAPGSGKTSLLVQLVLHYAVAGHPVVLLAADESAHGLLVRLGQLLGLDRGALERGDVETRRRLTALCVDLQIAIVDQDEVDGAGVESAAELLGAMTKRAGVPGVFAVDSAQTVRCAAGDAADGIRLRISAAAEALKRAAKAHDALVLCTSEMARSSYRSKRSGDNSEALASMKESGALEYAGSLIIALTTDGDDVVNVALAKNRLGRRPSFALQLDRERAMFVEVPEGDTEANAVESVARIIVSRLAATPAGVVGQQALRGLTGGNQSRRVAAVKLLLESGRVVGGGRTVPYTVAVEAEAAQ